MKLNDGRENADYYRKENIRLSVQNQRYKQTLEEIRDEASSYMGNSAAQRLYNIADKALEREG